MESILNETLLEQEVLFLQEFFWQKGIHTLASTSSESVYVLLKKFLVHLPPRAQIGCISLSNNKKLPLRAENIAQLYQKQLASKEASFFIEQLLLNVFYYDFFWIEYAADKEAPAWLDYFIEKLDEYWLAKEKTVLIFSVEKSL